MADPAEKTLKIGQRRYEAHQVVGSRMWSIYDRARGSWPLDTPWTGKVPEMMTKAEAENLAEKLEETR